MRVGTGCADSMPSRQKGVADGSSHQTTRRRNALDAGIERAPKEGPPGQDARCAGWGSAIFDRVVNPAKNISQAGPERAHGAGDRTSTRPAKKKEEIGKFGR